MSTPQRALVLVDIQQDYFNNSPLMIRYPNRVDSLAKITEAIDAAAAADIPVIMVQHTEGRGAPVFDPDSPGFAVRDEVLRRRQDSWKTVVKEFGSVYANTDVAQWLRERNVDTVTLVGYMTNNCVLASAVEGEGLGFSTEVLSDATVSIRRVEGHPILPPGATDIVSRGQGWCRWGPPAPTDYFPTDPILLVLAYCECLYQPRWCYARCDP